MKYLIIILTFIFSSMLAAEPSLNEIRTLFQKAESNKTACVKLINILKIYNETNNTTFAAYKACAAMMFTKFNLNPFKKLTSFKEGKTLLEKCILNDHDNMELRFLRFSIQCNAPAFLGYKDALLDDKTILLKALPNLNDIQLKKIMISFFMNSHNLTSIEKQNIKT